MTMFLITSDISSFAGGIYNLFQILWTIAAKLIFFQFSSLSGIEFCMLCCGAAMLPNQTTHLHMSTSSSPSDVLPGGLMRLQGAAVFCAGKGKFGLDVGPVGNLI